MEYVIYKKWGYEIAPSVYLYSIDNGDGQKRRDIYIYRKGGFPAASAAWLVQYLQKKNFCCLALFHKLNTS